MFSGTDERMWIRLANLEDRDKGDSRPGPAQSLRMHCQKICFCDDLSSRRKGVWPINLVQIFKAAKTEEMAALKGYFQRLPSRRARGMTKRFLWERYSEGPLLFS